MIDSALSLVSIVAGLPWGALGVAASYSLVGFCVRKPLLFWFACRTGPVRLADFYRAILAPACAALFVFGAVFAFRRWADGARPVTGLLASCAIAAAVAFLVLFTLPAGRRALKDVRSVLPLILKRKAPAA